MIGNIAIVIVSIIGMEIFALYFHKHFMHGRGWNWHESHHVHTDGPFEKNDLYAVCFSVIAAALFISGSLWWMPLGIWRLALQFTASSMDLYMMAWCINLSLIHISEPTRPY